jgi:hydrogenase maturation protease
VVFKVLIAGLGNVLLKDDGIGVRAAQLLRENPPPLTLVLPVGTQTFEALPWLRVVPKVLAIDAADAGGAPGSIYQWTVNDLRHPGITRSLHEMGLLSALEFLPRKARPAIIVLGVQPASIAYGPELTPSLERVLPQVVLAARYLTAQWALPLTGSASVVLKGAGLESRLAGCVPYKS